MSQKARGKIALERLLELLDDMGWDEDEAIAEFYEEIGKPTGLQKKAVEMWFNPKRRTLPSYALFNLAPFLGVDVNWLAGVPGITKDQALAGRRGLYHREVKREMKRVATKPKRSSG